MRINKYIAECGVASRRNSDLIIKEGRVKLNNAVVKECGVDIDEKNDSIYIDGKKISLPSSFTYIIFNKPKGCICTATDDKGRKTVFDYVKSDKRLFTVGRLDYDTEGMLLFTNDGEFANRLTHPTNEVPKTYIARIDGAVENIELAKLREGILIDGIKTSRTKIKLLEFVDNVSRVEVVIHEGRNRQVRKMFESINKEVLFLKRVAIGDFKMGGLPRSTFRYLTEDEIFYLKNL